MTMLLVAVFASVGLGLLCTNSGRREMMLALAIAVALTLAYYFRPTFMT